MPPENPDDLNNIRPPESDAKAEPRKPRVEELLDIERQSLRQTLMRQAQLARRAMMMKHLSETPEGQALVAKEIEKRKSIKPTEKGYLDALRDLVASPDTDLETMFPDAKAVIDSRRNQIDVSEEVNYLNNHVFEGGASGSRLEEIQIRGALQSVKQYDEAFPQEGRKSLLDRIKEGTSKPEFKDNAKKYGKVAAVGAVALVGVSMGGPGVIATMVAKKAASRLYPSLVNGTQKLMGTVEKAAVDKGYVSQEYVDGLHRKIDDANSKIKVINDKLDERKGWSTAKKLATVAVSMAAGVVAGDFLLNDAEHLKGLLTTAGEIASDLTDGIEAGMDEPSMDAESEVEGGPGPEEAGIGTLESGLGPVDAPVGYDATMDPRSPEYSGDSGVADISTEPEGLDEVAQGPSAEEVASFQEMTTHQIAEGDTMSDIAHSYLSERGIDVGAGQLYGESGILERAGMNTDFIRAGDTVDLSRLEEIAVELGAEPHPGMENGFVAEGINPEGLQADTPQAGMGVSEEVSQEAIQAAIAAAGGEVTPEAVEAALSAVGQSVSPEAVDAALTAVGQSVSPDAVDAALSVAEGPEAPSDDMDYWMAMAEERPGLREPFDPSNLSSEGLDAVTRLMDSFSQQLIENSEVAPVELADESSPTVKSPGDDLASFESEREEPDDSFSPG